MDAAKGLLHTRSFSRRRPDVLDWRGIPRRPGSRGRPRLSRHIRGQLQLQIDPWPAPTAPRLRRTLSWTMKIFYEFPGGRSRGRWWHTAPSPASTAALAPNNSNCTFTTAPAPSIPITLFIGDTVDEVDVSAEIPASTYPGGQLTWTGTGNCALKDLRGATAYGSQRRAPAPSSRRRPRSGLIKGCITRARRATRRRSTLTRRRRRQRGAATARRSPRLGRSMRRSSWEQVDRRCRRRTGHWPHSGARRRSR